jgi:flagellar biosynthetic protein FliP
MNAAKPKPLALAAALLVAVMAVSATACRGEPAAPEPPEPAGLDLPTVPLAERPPTPLRPLPAAPPSPLDWRVVASLAAVLAVFGGLRFVARRRLTGLPPDVYEVLGSATLGGQQAVRIVRFGPKTLLVSVSSSGCQTLSEIVDPEATARIAAACRGQQPPLRPMRRTVAAALVACLLVASAAAQAAEPVALAAADAATQPAAAAAAPGGLDGVTAAVRSLVGTRSLDAALSAAVMFTVVSLAPAVLLMTTCFVRMSVVLSLVRQGLGAAQLPSNQIVTSLALFLSAMVMWPVWSSAYRAGVEPYQAGTITLAQAYEQGTLPIRRWMAGQIEQAGNRDTMLLFLERHPTAPKEVATYDDVPVETLLPAFLVSELETAFTIGFRMLLPFLVLDVIVATLVVSTGLVMLPPTLVSLPLKLLVFVMADGWSLVVKSLLDSVWPAST